jgi:hypothetical protein
LITRIIFCDEYRSLSSSLCSLLHSPVVSSLLGPNIQPSVQVGFNFQFTLKFSDVLTVENKQYSWVEYSNQYHLLGRAMAQMAACHNRGPSLITCGICGGQSDNRFFSQYFSISFHQSSILNHSSFTHAVQCWQMTALLNNTLRK